MGSGASIGDVTGKLTLDSAEFDSKLAKSGEGLDRHAALTEKASERARKAWEKELVAQANAQRATEAAARAKELAALKTDILSRSTGNLEHATVSQMQATSASVRALEGNPGIRAVERFLTTIPGVGKALMAAFPVVGALAFAGVLVDMGEKVADFAKKVREMPHAIEQGFGSLNLSQRTSIDQLDLTNDKLQNAIDKMAKKPENNLKVAFDEAKLSADRVASSIENSNSKLNELLSKNHLSGMALLFGKQGTAEREGTTKAFGDQATGNAYDLADATSRGDTTGVAKAQRALQATQDAELANFRADLAKRQSTKDQPGRPDDSANIKVDQGVITNILNQRREEAALKLNAQKEAEKQLADDKRLAAEEAKQAAAKRLQDFEGQLAAEKLVRGASVKLDYEFWEKKQMAFRAGSEQYNSIIEKEAQLSIEAIKQAHEKILKFQAEQRRQPTAAEGDEIIAKFNEERQNEATKARKSQTQALDESYDLSILQARNQAKLEEADVYDRAGRSITNYAAALQVAQTHTKEFEIVSRSLQAELDRAKDDFAANNSPENQKAVYEKQEKLDNATSQRQIQTQVDKDAVNGRSSSGLVGAEDALRDFILATRDSASEMRNLTTNALQGFNAEVVKGISGQRTSFAGFGAGLGRDVAGSALRKGEGSLMSAVGLDKLGGKTKPTGSASDPLHVMVANIQAFQNRSTPQLNNLAPGLDTPLSTVPFSSLLPGSGGPAPNVGSLLGAALSLIPGFASGGAIDPNQWAIVGEEGPELFHSGGGGTIVPNHQISMGSGGGIHFHPGAIDARGSNDPAAVAAAVQRGIKAAAPHIAAAGVKATAEQRMRGPSSKR